MVLQDHTLTSELEIRKQPPSVTHVRSDSVYKVIGSKNVDSIWGALPQFVLVDELHVVPLENWLAIEDMCAKSNDSLLVTISTAGMGDTALYSPAYMLYNLTKRIADVEDPGGNLSFFGVWYGADEQDDWTKEETWAKANPSWGISPPANKVRDEYKKALKTPSKVPHFRTIRLNIWSDVQTQGLFSMEGWQKGQTDFDPGSLVGRECFGGTDLSEVSDLTASSSCSRSRMSE
jgi:phage terminase large subunit-like protein